MELLHTEDYKPQSAVINEIIEENSQIKTFVLSFTDEEHNQRFKYQPGQFMMVSIPNCGEAPISFSSTPTRPGKIHLSVRNSGKLTGAMFRLSEGAIIGLRGPYGRPFPVKNFEGKDILFVAGGIGLAPLRGVINYCLDHKDRFGKVTILYGSRLPSDIAFADDIKTWLKCGFNCQLSVDVAEANWHGSVGVVTTLLSQVEMDVKKGVALICGPSMMIRFVMAELSRMGFSDDDIITTMERHMKCGVGICRHCHMDGKLVCVDGPVFSKSQLRGLKIMEISA